MGSNPIRATELPSDVRVPCSLSVHSLICPAGCEQIQQATRANLHFAISRSEASSTLTTS